MRTVGSREEFKRVVIIIKAYGFDFHNTEALSLKVREKINVGSNNTHDCLDRIILYGFDRLHR